MPEPKKEPSPGPYHVGHEAAFSIGFLEIGNVKGRRIATLDARDYRQNIPQLYADANLFAASWDLLQSLKESTEAMKRMDRKILELTGQPFECEKGEVLRAEQAILKAGGPS